VKEKSQSCVHLFKWPSRIQPPALLIEMNTCKATQPLAEKY